MDITRREFSGGVAAFVASSFTRFAHAARTTKKGPQLLRAKRGSSEVTILGFGEAKDDTWFSPQVSQAFDASNRLWLEVAPPDLAAPSDPATKARVEELSHTSSGTFLDSLSPGVRAQAIRRITELGIQDKDISTLRPWKAYYVFMSAYFRSHPQAETKYVDEFLAKRAVTQHKQVSFEFPSGAAFSEYMAQMSANAQDQYISWLLTYLDEQDQGLNDRDPFGWETGHPPRMTRSLARMIQMRSLYEVMQTRRNDWWANKVVELLNTGGQYFIGIGLLHTLGPTSIPNQLKSLGVHLEGHTYDR